MKLVWFFFFLEKISKIDTPLAILNKKKEYSNKIINEKETL